MKNRTFNAGNFRNMNAIIKTSALAQKTAGRKPPYDATIFGEDSFMSMNCLKTNMNNNVMVVGTSGTGKTRSFVIPNVLQMNANYIISDSKGDIYRACYRPLVDAGYNVKVLNLQNLERVVNHYNPLLYVSNEQDLSLLINTILGSDITGEKTKSLDSFWNETSRILLTALILYLLEYGSPREQNLSAVCDLLHTAGRNNREKSKLEQMFLEIAAIDPDDDCVKWFNDFSLVGEADRTRDSIIMSTVAKMSVFKMNSVRELMRFDDLELWRFTEERIALFVIIDDTDPTKNYISNILYTQLFKLLCRKADEGTGALPYHTRFFLDDFASVYIPNFNNVISDVRSRNISVAIMCQNESQLSSRYGVLYKSIIGNCSSYLFMGSTDLYACREVAERFSMNSRDVLLLDNDYCLAYYEKTTHRVRKFAPTNHPNYRDQSSRLDEILYSGEQYRGICFNNKVLTKEEIIQFDIETRKENVNELLEIQKRQFAFDSNAESEFYKKLVRRLNSEYALSVTPHVQLDRIFTCSDVYRLKMMHVDFVLYSEPEHELLLAVELDGPYHSDEVQKKRDEFKNKYFQKYEIELIRVAVDSDFEQAIERIIEAAISKLEKNREQSTQKVHQQLESLIDMFDDMEKKKVAPIEVQPIAAPPFKPMATNTSDKSNSKTNQVQLIPHVSRQAKPSNVDK